MTGSLLISSILFFSNLKKFFKFSFVKDALSLRKKDNKSYFLIIFFNYSMLQCLFFLLD